MKRYAGTVFTRATLPSLAAVCGCLVPWGDPDERDEPVDNVTRFVANEHCARCSGSGRMTTPRPAPTPEHLRALAARPSITPAELVDRANVTRLVRYGARWAKQ